MGAVRRSPRAQSTKAGCASRLIANTVASRSAVGLDGRRASASSFSIMLVATPTRAANAAWVRSSALRRWRSQLPNETRSSITRSVPWHLSASVDGG